MIFFLVVVLFRVGLFRGHGVHSDPWRAGVGLVLFALGLGFAVWARLHIGRNWGPVALAGIYFIYSATVEERFLTEQFPDAYPAYKRSTKMLMPFVL